MSHARTMIVGRVLQSEALASTAAEWRASRIFFNKIIDSGSEYVASLLPFCCHFAAQ
jgi:hypothetical protein